jgi:protein-tyrosine phosphatase
MMTTDQILPLLWQGSHPDEGGTLRRRGFHTVVLCAHEYQPGRHFFPGVEVFYCPLADDGRPVSSSERTLVLNTAARVARRVESGRRVLVTCWQGRNRSGLITALATMMVTGCDGKRAVLWVQAHRPYSLTNPAFVEFLDHLSLLRGPRPDPSKSLISGS